MLRAATVDRSQTSPKFRLSTSLQAALGHVDFVGIFLKLATIHKQGTSEWGSEILEPHEEKELQEEIAQLQRDLEREEEISRQLDAQENDWQAIFGGS